ncbi:hypothetical protein GCM10010211_63170 [Streptomyces albospinus]|uniref:AMP-dependent synthetase/ligase domain-containing protein n=1 Tax=Streptomyces albospinus TaxID=285515 RepID=A0ABQ2VI98_9ACTN|nr:hypothetical protein GCM10010211_63170 [Streptomyces albospinus]
MPSLRLLAGGGAPKPPELYHEFVAELGCQLTHGYALTEAPMVTMGDPCDSPELLAGTDGRPPAGMEIRIAPDSGEILLRGPSVFRGYLDEPAPPPCLPAALAGPGAAQTARAAGGAARPAARRDAAQGAQAGLRERFGGEGGGGGEDGDGGGGGGGGGGV